MKKKENLRKKILNIRNSMEQCNVESKSEIIVNKVIHLINERNFQNIMIYMDMRNEVKITKLLNKFNNGRKNFYIPKIFPDRSMKINRYVENELILHKYGYEESLSEVYSDIETPDLVIIPGVVFDRKRNRIGFGGGYYDRFLKKLEKREKPPLTVAVCYNFQVLQLIPSEAYDMKPHMIITETDIIT